MSSNQENIAASPENQIMYVNFEGGNGLSYDNGEWSRTVNMTAADYSQDEIADIIAKLNESADPGVTYTAVQPLSGDYSTIYVGSTTDFDDLGSFAGLAETIDEGNQIATDEAFVNLAYIASTDQLISVIDHEAGHLMGESHSVTTGTIADYAKITTGVICEDGDSITLVTGETYTCSASGGKGPAIDQTGGTVTGTNITFDSCSGGTKKGVCAPGVILTGSGTITLSGTTVFSNNSSDEVSAIEIYIGEEDEGKSDITLGASSTDTTTFSGNTGFGAVILLENYTAESTNAKITFNGTTEFTGNTSTGDYVFCSVNGTILFNGDVTFSDNTAARGCICIEGGTLEFKGNATINNSGPIAFAAYGSKLIGAQLRFHKTLTLSTSNDSIDIGTDGGTAMYWDITGGSTEGNYAKLVNYQYVTNGTSTADCFFITVTASQASGTYTICTGVEDSLAANKSSFTLTDGSSTKTITVGDTDVEFSGTTYSLAHDTDADTLVLTVGGGSSSGPTGAVTTDTTNWFNAASGTITIEGTYAADAGIKTITSSTGDTVSGYTGGGTSGSWSFAYGGSDTQNTTITMLLTDQNDATNTDEVSCTIKVDREGPTISSVDVAGMGTVYNPETDSYWVKQQNASSLYAGFSDLISGFARATLNGGEETTETFASWSIDVSSDHELQENTIAAYDNAGNSSVKTVKIGVDGTAPVIDLTPSTTDPAAAVTLTVATSDTGSGVAAGTLYYNKDGGDWVTCGDELEIAANGTYNFKVQDNVGNEGTNSITITNIGHTVTGATNPVGIGGIAFDQSGVVLAGTTVTATATAAAGYTFTGFTSSPEASFTGSDYVYTFIMPDEAITVTANYTANSYALSGASSPEGATVSFTVGGASATTATVGQTVTVTTTEMAGYSFTGFTSDQITDFTQVSEYVYTFTMVAEDVTVTANYGVSRIVVTDGQTYPLTDGKTYTMPEYTGNGGAAYVYAGGTLTGNNVTFTGNNASGENSDGGAIYSAGTLTITGNSVFSNNTAYKRGGALYAQVEEGHSLSMTDVSFTGNTAADGGAVELYGSTGTFTWTNVAVSNNTAVNGGGLALYDSNPSSFIVTGSTFSNNTAGGNGGAIALIGCDEATITFTGATTISNNTAEGCGGAVYISYTKLAVFDGVTFSGNTVTGGTGSAGGGAVYLTNSSNASFSDVTFSGNTSSTMGGAIYVNSGCSITLSDVTFTGNSASQPFGGAVFNGQGTAVLNGSVTLSTSTDTWTQLGGSVTWDLTQETATNSVTFNNYQWFTNFNGLGTLYLKVDASQTAGTYTIATGVEDELADAKSSFTLTDGTNEQAITVGDTGVAFNGMAYSLTHDTDADTLVLSVEGFHTLTGVTSPLTGFGELTFKVSGETVTSAAAGQTVTVTAATAPELYEFAGFTSDQDVTFSGSGYEYTFTMPDSDITVLGTYNHTGTAYINSEYTEESAGGHTFGVDAFTNFDDALALNYITMTQTGGTYNNGTKENPVVDEAAQGAALVVENATYGSYNLLSGGVHSNTAEVRNWVDETGNTSVTITAGTFGANVLGADVCTSGSLYRTGNSAMTINGGTFSSGIAGGIYYRTNDRSTKEKLQDGAYLEGDIAMTITGGTFEKRVYGGNYATTDDDGARTIVDGNINLTINATSAISFSEHVVAGSRGEGWVTGNVNVTVTGNGSNLTFASGKYLYGGSGRAYYRTEGTAREEISYVLGSRNLVFNDFSGEFSGRIWMFQSIEFSGSTAMTFRKSQEVDLTDISAWNLNWDGNTETYADLTDVINTFTNDTVNIKFESASAEDILLKGATGCFDTLSDATVQFNGTTVGYEKGTGWVSGSNILFIEDNGENAYLKMATLA